MKSKVPYQKKGKRLGRGIGSGRGKTCGRGHKGQGSRSGAKLRPGFEGGQNPLYRRLPKRGFNNAAFRKEYAIVNLDRLAMLNLSEVSPEILLERGMLKKIHHGLRVLGDGELNIPIKVKAHYFSKSAKEKIEKSGGKVILLEKNQNN